MGVWQIIFIGMLCLSVGISLANHGKPKDGNYNFFTSLIAGAIEIAILYFGGFFS